MKNDESETAASEIAVALTINENDVRCASLAILAALQLFTASFCKSRDPAVVVAANRYRARLTREAFLAEHSTPAAVQ
jgi:hypothetical protein